MTSKTVKNVWFYAIECVGFPFLWISLGFASLSGRSVLSVVADVEGYYAARCLVGEASNTAIAKKSEAREHVVSGWKEVNLKRRKRKVLTREGRYIQGARGRREVVPKFCQE